MLLFPQALDVRVSVCGWGADLAARLFRSRGGMGGLRLETVSWSVCSTLLARALEAPGRSVTRDPG